MKNKFLKGIIALTITGVSILLLPIGANAEWKQNSIGWWYIEGNAYATGWRLIDGNWYYFYSNGYMASNTKIDDYYLNSSGTWIQNASLNSKKEKVLFFINRGYEKNNKKYIEGYFDKFVTDLDEARDYILDDGFDIPISKTTTLEVDDGVNISEVDFDSKGSILNVTKDFNSIIIGKYKDWPIFEVTFKEGVVTELHQEYRP